MEIYELSETEVDDLSYALRGAVTLKRGVRVAVDAGGVKFKVGEGMWSPPLGRREETGDPLLRAVLMRQADEDAVERTRAAATEGRTEGDV